MTNWKISDLKIINYYPRTHSWTRMWDDTWWNSGDAETEIKEELDWIKSYINTVRIFVDYSTFGGASVDTIKRGRLENVISWIGERGMKSIVTLFDGVTNIDSDQWDNHKSHIDGIVDYFKNNKYIRFWDLRNEFTLQPSGYNYKQREVWIREMLVKVKSLDTLHPCTAEADAAGSQWCSDSFDLLCSHLYKTNASDNPLEVDNLYASTHTCKGKSYYCGETGRDTYNYTSQQAHDYIKDTLDGLKTRDCGVGLWTLNIFSDLGEGAEKYFGILDKNSNYHWKQEDEIVVGEPFLDYFPTYQESPRSIWNDAWSISNDTQDFDSAFGLTTISGIWDRIDEGVPRNYVARQLDDSDLTGPNNPFNLKVAVTSDSNSVEHTTIKCEVKLTQEPEIGILVNYSDLKNCYRVYLYKEGDTQTFGLKRIKDGSETLLSEVSTTVTLDTWYTITIHIHENTYNFTTYKNIRCFLNNGLIDILLEYNDEGNRLMGGKAGIYTGGSGKGRFNNYNANYIIKTRTYLTIGRVYILDKEGNLFRLDSSEMSEEVYKDLLIARVGTGVVDFDKVGE